ncbi:uncharacterized protein CDAR_376201 [Caerostris darwini]|uniref:Uncharacterized protein n=1 Tax=Caerostris darwini TaxID=1538125 RepID=A0AAV4PFN0_9ARAC|nr:uncharacterized protein CDAR_376201 [Caerostris darwini]
MTDKKSSLPSFKKPLLQFHELSSDLSELSLKRYKRSQTERSRIYNTINLWVRKSSSKLITRATWGLTPKVKKDIFLKVIDRIISYGHEVWYQDKVKLNLKVLQLQRIGLLNVTKCYSSVSTEALQVLAGIPPLDIKLKNDISSSTATRSSALKELSFSRTRSRS